MKRICSYLLAILLLLSVSACGQKAALETSPTWQDQYDLGIRYLSEGNYEEAIIAFTAAIEIDSKQADAYIQLANVYIGIGDVTNATDILYNALDCCDDLASAADMLAQLESGNFSYNITLTDVRYIFDCDSDIVGLSGNEGAIGGLSVEFTVAEPANAVYADIEIISDLICLADLIADMREFGQGVSPMPGTSDWWLEMPVFDDTSEVSQYIVVVAFDSTHDFVGYSVVGNIGTDIKTASNSGNETYGERIAKLFEKGYTGSGLSIDDASFMGQSIVNLDIMTMESILREKGYVITTNQDWDDYDIDDYYWFSADSDWGVSPSISAFQFYSSTSVDSWGYTHYGFYNGAPIPVGICNIYTQDSMETVLSKLGFENAEDIVETLNDLASVTFQNYDAMYTELAGAECHYNNGALFSIALDLGGTFVDYENSEEMRWSGAGDANCSMGFTVSIFYDINEVFLAHVLYIDFSFENGYLESVDFRSAN